MAKGLSEKAAFFLIRNRELAMSNYKNSIFVARL